MSGRQKSVLVYIDAEGMGSPALMGTLHAQSSGRQEVFSFEYAPEWLASKSESFPTQDEPERRTCFQHKMSLKD
jgi:hypothetical protein